MKRIIIGLVASLGLVASISSCKGYFNTEPSNATGTEKALKEASLLQPSLRGLFDGLQGGRIQHLILRSILHHHRGCTRG